MASAPTQQFSAVAVHIASSPANLLNLENHDARLKLQPLITGNHWFLIDFGCCKDIKLHDVRA